MASAIIPSILWIWRWYVLLRVAGKFVGFGFLFLLYFCAFEIAPFAFFCHRPLRTDF